MPNKWMNKLDKRSGGTDQPRDVKIISGTERPFAFHICGDINGKLVGELKRLRSPGDNWTYALSWEADEKSWAHLVSKENGAFTSLRDFMDSPWTTELLNNRDLIAGVSYVQDTVDGRVISKTKAFELNDKWRPGDDAGHDSEPEPGPSSTPQSRKRTADPETTLQSGRTASKARRWLEATPGLPMLCPAQQLSLLRSLRYPEQIAHRIVAKYEATLGLCERASDVLAFADELFMRPGGPRQDAGIDYGFFCARISHRLLLRDLQRSDISAYVKHGMHMHVPEPTVPAVYERHSQSKRYYHVWYA